MNIERWISLAVAFLLLGSCWRVAGRSLARGDGLITAETVFMFVWGLVLGLFAIPWIKYSPTSLTAWVAIYGSIATFLIGCWSARRVLSSLASRKRDAAEPIDQLRFCITWLFTFALGMIGFAGFVHAVDVTIGWKALYLNPAATRALQSTNVEFKSSYGIWRLFSYATPISLLLWSIGVRGRLFRGIWTPAWVIGLFALVPYVFTSERGLLVNSLIWILLFHLIWRPPAHPRRLIVIAAVAGAVLLSVFTVLGQRAGKTLSSHPEIAAQMTSQSPEALALPYVYLTANIPAFGQLPDDPIRPHTDGKMMVLPLVKVAHRLGIGGPAPEQSGAYYPIPFETFNNLSWLSSLYLDWGLLGCLIAPLLFGFLACWLVLLALRKGSLLAIWFGSLALFVVSYTPVVNRLTSTFVWEYALAGPFIVLLIRANPSPSQWVRTLPTRLRSTKVKTSEAVVVALAVGLIVIPGLAAAILSPSSGSANPQATVKQALARADKTLKDGSLPGDLALASRLHAADPAHAYTPICNESLVPEKRGVIGVFTDGRRARLTFHAPDGRVVSSAPPVVDLATLITPFSINRQGSLRGELPPDRKHRYNHAVSRIILPSSPKQGASVEVQFRSSDPTLAKAQPYFLRRYCTENLLVALRWWRLAPTPFVATTTKDGVTKYSGTALADRPGLTWLDVYVENPAAVSQMRNSLVGYYRLTITPPGK